MLNEKIMCIRRRVCRDLMDLGLNVDFDFHNFLLYLGTKNAMRIIIFWLIFWDTIYETKYSK